MKLDEQTTAAIEDQVLQIITERLSPSGESPPEWWELAERELTRMATDLVAIIGKLPKPIQRLRRKMVVGAGFDSASADDQKTLKSAARATAAEMGYSLPDQKKLVDAVVKSIPSGRQDKISHLAAGIELDLDALFEKAPPGWAGTVKAMKKHMSDDKAFALAWSGYKKGHEPHYKDGNKSTTSKGEPEKKKKYQESDALVDAMSEGGDGCPCGNDHNECGCKTCKKLKAKERKMEGIDDEFLDTIGGIKSDVGNEGERPVPGTPGPIGKPNTTADQRPEAGSAKSANSISDQLAGAIGTGVSSTGPENPGVGSIDRDRGNLGINAFNWPDVVNKYQASMGEEDLDANDLFHLAIAEDDDLIEGRSLPVATMAIADFLATKQGKASVAELHAHGVTERWAKKLVALSETAFGGTGVPREDVQRRQADPARYFREKVHSVLVAMTDAGGMLAVEGLDIGDGALSGNPPVGAGYDPAFPMGGNEDLATERPVNREAAAAAIQDGVSQSNRTAKTNVVEPQGIGQANAPTRYRAESLNDYDVDDRIRMAEAYDRMVGGASNLSREELVDAEKYKALVTKHASRATGRSNNTAPVRTTKVTESKGELERDIKAAHQHAFRDGDHPRATAIWRAWKKNDLKALVKLGAISATRAKEDVDDAFEDALVIEGALGESTGHHYFDGKDYYADTAFMNSLSGIMSGQEMKHMGFGEFSWEGPEGRVEFDRMRGKDFPGQSGRSHKLYDDKKGKLVAKLVKAMEAKRKSELVSEDADWNDLGLSEVIDPVVGMALALMGGQAVSYATRKAMAKFVGLHTEEPEERLVKKLVEKFKDRIRRERAKREDVELEEGNAKVIAKGEGVEVRASQWNNEGSHIVVLRNGKKIAEGDYDRGAETFFISHKSFRGQKPFDSAKDIAKHFAKMKESLGEAIDWSNWPGGKKPKFNDANVIAAGIRKALENGIGKGTKVKVVKARSTTPRGWDSGVHAVFAIKLPGGDKLNAAFTINTAEDGQKAGGNVHLDANYGGVISGSGISIPREVSIERFISTAVSDVVGHLRRKPKSEGLAGELGSALAVA
jgi:hypothetical protein